MGALMNTRLQWHMKKATVVLLVTCMLAFSSHTYAQETDLIAIYEKALAHDALLASIRFENEATQELISQGRSLFLPNITATLDYDDNNNERKILTPSISSNVLLSGNQAKYHSYDYGITITQPLFNYGAFQQYKQILSQTSLSEKKLLQAQQDLIYRVALIYFETLMARDEVGLLQAQKASINEQLIESEARYDVGLISITDVNESKTKAAMIDAQIIAAIQRLKIKNRQIESLTGELPDKIKGINSRVSFVAVTDMMEDWISLAIENNLELKIIEDEIKIADTEIDVRRSNHYPTIDATASRSRNWDKGGYPYGALANEGVRSFSDVLGVTINIPIFSGGYTSSRVREAQKLKLKTAEDAEYLKRQVELKVREHYLNLQANFAEIEAYQQALNSATLQVESTQLAFQEGLRNSVEVLISQQILFNAQRDLLKSRYNYLMNIINLKLSVGILAQQDLEEINRYLSSE
jgi:TolC family type I secretion outer membrane protein